MSFACIRVIKSDFACINDLVKKRAMFLYAMLSNRC